ncbi:MAG: hypothetical protein ACXAEN_21345, partial [Candidatus Thorarchaeota archaeon]
MQDFASIAVVLRDISFGILLVGLFYTFGMFLVGRLFSAISEYGASHEVEHDIDHDVDHDVEHDYDHDVDHDIDHDYDHDIDYDIGHDVEHDIDHDVDHDIDHDIDHEVDHDIDHDVEHDVDHDAEHDADHDTDHETDHDSDHDHDIDHSISSAEHSGFFETERGAPLGVTIGTSLVTFGFLGSVLYYEGLLIPFPAKVVTHVLSVVFLVYVVRTVLGKLFVESGFHIKPRHLVGREVEAVSTVRDDFGEVRLETEMGLRRFHARPFQKGVVFEKGTNLYVVSADDKF